MMYGKYSCNELKILFQRVVSVVPTLGTDNTNGWYKEYQSVVQGIPKCGTRNTNGWYGEYRTGEYPAACGLMLIASVSRFRLR